MFGKIECISAKLNKLIFKLIKWTGLVFSIPIIVINAFFKKPPLTFILWEDDFEDTHTWKHFIASMVLTLFAFSVLSLKPLICFWIGFGVMYIYEIFDGFRIFDERGYQISDIGADFWGAYITYILLTLI